MKKTSNASILVKAKDYSQRLFVQIHKLLSYIYTVRAFFGGSQSQINQLKLYDR